MTGGSGGSDKARERFVSACGEHIEELLRGLRAAGGDELELEAVAVEALVSAWRRWTDPEDPARARALFLSCARRETARLARRGLPLDAHPARGGDGALPIEDAVLDRVAARIAGIDPAPHRELVVPARVPIWGGRRIRPALALAAGLAGVLLGSAAALGAMPRDHGPAVMVQPRGGDVIRPLPSPVVSFPDPQAAVAVGLRLSRLRMVDASQGWAMVQDSGRLAELAVTDDGGQVWTKVTQPPQAVVSAATFLDADQAVVAGGRLAGGACPASRLVLQRTADRGQTWTGLSDFSGQGFPQEIAFLDAQHGWMTTSTVCGGAPPQGQQRWLYTTANGGRTWTPRPLALPARAAGAFVVDSFSFSAPLRGFAVSAGQSVLELRATRDGGRTWSLVRLPTHPVAGTTYLAPPPVFSGSREGLMPVRTYDPNLKGGRLANSTLLATHDGGTTWVATQLPFTLVGQDFHLSPRLWAVGFGSGGARVWRSDDGGRQWSQISGDLVAPGTVIEFVDRDHGWINPSGYDTGIPNPAPLYRTLDGGVTFDSILASFVGPLVLGSPIP
ncbi:MAG TPA: hypothetical protein VG245_00885 [Candidatus Dormibacteraeota bacterium]|nr:hypothetical protein [Candidatus Dormibacteraeota bacterium]